VVVQSSRTFISIIKLNKDISKLQVWKAREGGLDETALKKSGKEKLKQKACRTLCLGSWP
jgi:hypothetical protein